jgi:hypothetical protein
LFAQIRAGNETWSVGHAALASEPLGRPFLAWVQGPTMRQAFGRRGGLVGSPHCKLGRVLPAFGQFFCDR